MATDGSGAALMLSPESPYPLAGGGALRTASLLEYLARSRPVDLIVFRQPGATDPAREIPSGMVRRVSVIDLPANRRTLAARAARNAGRLARRVPPLVDRFGGFETQVSAAIGTSRYAIGVVEHSWCMPYGAVLEPHCKRTVLNLHNVESVLHSRCAETERGAARFAHELFRRASVELEREWLPRFSLVLAPSANDVRAARAIAPGAHLSVYPNAIPPQPPPERADLEIISFSGNLDYHPNVTAVRFFREKVWPGLREQWPNLRWRLIGKNPQAVSEFTSGDPRIEVTGPVDDAVAALACGRAAVVPLLSGSGTRLKILEAWSAGIAVVSTTVGAEGLGARDGDHLLIADDPAAFALAVSRVLTLPELRARLAAGGRRLLEERFTWPSAWRELAHMNL